MAFQRKRHGNALAAMAGMFVALCPLLAMARQNADDYASTGLRASAEAQAVFGTVKNGAPSIWVSRGGSGGGASFTEDGGISIPAGAMVEFEYTGQCMDPNLPAPAQGEPMQFVDSAELIPARLRKTYENLLALQAAGDRRITSAGMQQLVWALRTAGTAGSIADNLSEDQRRILDTCSGRKNGFTRYHEKEKARNAKCGAQERISVGNLSYDPADLRGEEAGARIQSHVDELVAMGRDAGVAGTSGFRYAKIEEELYTDIVSEGGLSVKARVLNASGRTRVFRPADCAAQAGDGSVPGSRRQRVTMNVPDKVRIVPDALGQEMQTDWDASSTELEENEWHRRTERRRETRTVRVAESIPAVSPVTPVSPVPPVGPVPVITNMVTNTIVRVVPEEIDVRVAEMEYDPEARRGVLKLEVKKGSFQKAFKHIRSNFNDLLRRDGRAMAAGVPLDAEWNIDGISVNEEDICEVLFSALESPGS